MYPVGASLRGLHHGARFKHVSRLYSQTLLVILPTVSPKHQHYDFQTKAVGICVQPTASLDFFLFTFHLSNARSYDACAKGQCSLQSSDIRSIITTGMCICRAAAAAVETLLATEGPSAKVVRTELVPELEASGTAFSNAIHFVQQHEVAEAIVPEVLNADQDLQQATELLVEVPCETSAAKPHSGDAQTTAPLLPLTRPPDSTNARGAENAAHMLQWLQQLSGSGTGTCSSTVFAAIEQAEQLFYRVALLAEDWVGIYTVSEIADLSALATEVRRRLRAAASLEGKDRPWLQVEYRSREALISWITLAAIHRSAVDAWPALHHYHLPLNPDDLHLLTLRSHTAERAALAVAAYVAAHAGPERQVFSTESESVTMDLAADYVATGPPPAFKLLDLLRDEHKLAHQREDAHWAAVQQKLQDLARLDKELAQAVSDTASAKRASEVAYGALNEDVKQASTRHREKIAAFRTSVQTANLQRAWNRIESGTKARYPCYNTDAKVSMRLALEQKEEADVVALPEYKTMLSAQQAMDVRTKDFESASAYKSQDALANDGNCSFAHGSFQTIPGRNWREEFNAYITLRRRCAALRREIAETEKPPPPLYHPLPNAQASPRDARAVLFWLYPEHTGFMPYLAAYCFEAQQVRFFICR
jgi:hypothetical protein